MKIKLFENIGGNTFKLVSPQPMGMMETSTDSWESAFKSEFNPDSPINPQEKYVEIKNRILKIINLYNDDPGEQEEMRKLFKPVLDKLENHMSNPLQ